MNGCLVGWGSGNEDVFEFREINFCCGSGSYSKIIGFVGRVGPGFVIEFTTPISTDAVSTICVP